MTTTVVIDNTDSGTTESPDLLKPEEVAAIFRVSLETVRRWGRGGKLDTVATPSGRRLYRRNSVERLLTSKAA